MEFIDLFLEEHGKAIIWGFAGGLPVLIIGIIIGRLYRITELLEKMEMYLNKLYEWQGGDDRLESDFESRMWDDLSKEEEKRKISSEEKKKLIKR